MESSVPGFKVAFRQLLEADNDIGVAGVQVSGGNPHPKAQERELIIIGDASGIEREYTAGMQRANESYTVAGLVSVIRNVEEDRETVEARAYEIMTAIEVSALAWGEEDVLFGGVANIVLVFPTGDSEIIPEENTDIREVSIGFIAKVKARIS